MGWAQDLHTIDVEGKSVEIPPDITVSRAMDAFEFVMRHGSKIELDHYILYHTREYLTCNDFLRLTIFSTCKIMSLAG